VRGVDPQKCLERRKVREPDAERPTLVMNLGSDEAITGLWSQGAEGALERGYNVVLYEGPGQQSMLFERGIPFRHDWEKVLTPVVDFHFRSRPYGITGYSAGLDAVARYDLTDVAGRITTPLYVIDTDGDQFFAGQPAELAELVPGSTYARFTQAEGASYHCQPLARELTEQRMFDWMDEQIGR
jgi:hypothetical protein